MVVGWLPEINITSCRVVILLLMKKPSALIWRSLQIAGKKRSLNFILMDLKMVCNHPVSLWSISNKDLIFSCQYYLLHTYISYSLTQYVQACSFVSVFISIIIGHIMYLVHIQEQSLLWRWRLDQEESGVWLTSWTMLVRFPSEFWIRNIQ